MQEKFFDGGEKRRLSWFSSGAETVLASLKTMMR
jgi:hypothetical protein